MLLTERAIASVVAALACILAAGIGIAEAKRAAPEAVEPVTVHGITYSAPPDAIGFVVARNASSGRELWRQRIYSVRINPALERDVQDLFITTLKVRGGTLLVTNERGEHFVLNLQTRRVIRESNRDR